MISISGVAHDNLSFALSHATVHQLSIVIQTYIDYLTRRIQESSESTDLKSFLQDHLDRLSALDNVLGRNFNQEPELPYNQIIEYLYWIIKDSVVRNFVNKFGDIPANIDPESVPYEVIEFREYIPLFNSEYTIIYSFCPQLKGHATLIVNAVR